MQCGNLKETILTLHPNSLQRGGSQTYTRCHNEQDSKPDISNLPLLTAGMVVAVTSSWGKGEKDRHLLHFQSCDGTRHGPRSSFMIPVQTRTSQCPLSSTTHSKRFHHRLLCPPEPFSLQSQRKGSGLDQVLDLSRAEDTGAVARGEKS